MSLRVCLYNLTTTTQLGGVETFVAQLARQLVKMGHCPIVVGGRGPWSPYIPDVEVLQFPFVSRSTLRRLKPLSKAYTLTKLLERLSFALWAVPALRSKKFDIIHIQKPYDLIAATVLKRWTGAALVLGSHGRDFFIGDRFFVRWVDAAAACSLFNAQEALVSRYHLPGLVVYNGVDVEMFRYLPDAVLRERLARGQDHLLLSVGRLVSWKGLDTVLEATAIARSKGFGVALAIAGDGPARHDLTQLVRQLGLETVVTFMGSVPYEQMPTTFSSCDMLLAGSYANETFGIALVEAMACARPVVATRFGGFPEVVEDGLTGYLTAPRDPQAMAEAICDLLVDRDKAHRFGIRGRQRVEEMFTWEAVASRVLKVYETALSNVAR